MESHEIVEIVTTTMPGGGNPRLPQDGAFYGLGVHTMDQIISLFGRPIMSYDIRSLRNKANPDDTLKPNCFTAPESDC